MQIKRQQIGRFLGCVLILYNTKRAADILISNFTTPPRDREIKVYLHDTDGKRIKSSFIETLEKFDNSERLKSSFLSGEYEINSEYLKFTTDTGEVIEVPYSEFMRKLEKIDPVIHSLIKNSFPEKIPEQVNEPADYLSRLKQEMKTRKHLQNSVRVFPDTAEGFRV